MPQSLDRWTPILVGGAVGGALSLLPPCCLLTCCCCFNGVYFLIGGAVAGAMLARSAGRAGIVLPVEQGMLVGLGAGAVAALMTIVVYGAFDIVQELSGWRPEFDLEGLSGLSPELRNLVERLEELIEEQRRAQPPVIVRMAITTGLHLLLGLALGALGGLLGTLIGRGSSSGGPGDRAAAPSRPPAPPSTTPTGPEQSRTDADGAWSVGSRTPEGGDAGEPRMGTVPYDPSSAWDRAREELERPPDSEEDPDR